VRSHDQIGEIILATLDVLIRAGTRVYGEEGLGLLRSAEKELYCGSDKLAHAVLKNHLRT
jgi:hypothetical protein